MKCLKMLVLLWIILSGASVKAQSLSIVSHYPSSAFVVDRLLPFTVMGPDNLVIESIQITGGEGCQSLVDPFHSKVFHIYCKQASVVSGVVTVLDPVNGKRHLPLSLVNVVEESAPGQSWGSSFKNGGGS